MKKKPIKSYKLIPIKTAKQLEIIINTVENDSYYITFNGEVVSFEDDIIFSKRESEDNLSKLIVAARQTYAEATEYKEKAEAFQILNSLRIMPVRLH